MTHTIQQKQANERLSRDADKVTENDVFDIMNRADEIRDRVESNGPLKRFVKDVSLMSSLIRDYWNHSYREIHWWALSAVVAALAYVLSPIDLIPDILPLFGFVDDAMVVGACLLLVEQQLSEYEAWKLTQKKRLT